MAFFKNSLSPFPHLALPTCSSAGCLRRLRRHTVKQREIKGYQQLWKLLINFKLFLLHKFTDVALDCYWTWIELAADTPYNAIWQRAANKGKKETGARKRKKKENTTTARETRKGEIKTSQRNISCGPPRRIRYNPAWFTHTLQSGGAGAIDRGWESYGSSH